MAGPVYPSDIGGFVIGFSPIGEPIFSPPTPGLADTIPAYVYKQYDDDDDVVAFVRAFNDLAQTYVNWFNAIGLPIYTGPLIYGLLLDWVAAGLYGILRPVLPSDVTRSIGPFDTWALNTLQFNEVEVTRPVIYFATNDDYFRRCITWHFYKGDGKVFNVRWLKRRIMRFLIGDNGSSPNVDETYPVSVTFGTDAEVSIRISPGVAKITGGAIFNDFAIDTQAFNATQTTFQSFDKFAAAPTLKAAIDAGVLELPFQFHYDVAV